MATDMHDEKVSPSHPENGKNYGIDLLITQDEYGTFSAVALNLPGAGSCGPTAEVATERAIEAIQGVLESYLEDGDEIPWEDSAQALIPFGAVQKRIFVHA
jgi:predicted RNase H-like HicB family nuclease